MGASRASNKKDSDEAELAGYRDHLVAAEQKSQEDFDKTVLSLSGGALGVSFVFLKDVLGDKPILEKSNLLLAWMAWGLSSIVVLASFYLSHLSLRRAISQLDEGTIRTGRAGGWYSVATAILNASGAILFFTGVVFITLFANANLQDQGSKDVRQEAKPAPAQAISANPDSEKHPTANVR